MHIWKHFCTITKHRNMVMKNCFRAGIPLQGLRHDLSKYSPTEFITGAKYYQGYRSPNARERELYGFSKAWLHHKGRNKHHFEYWTDYDKQTDRMKPVRMPIPYVKEMFCDRVAASRIYKGKDYTDSASLEYFQKSREDRFMHPETAALMEKLLVMLAEKGEDETFAYIRKLKEYTSEQS